MRLSVLLSVHLLVFLSINQARAQTVFPDCNPLSGDRLIELTKRLGYRGNGDSDDAQSWIDSNLYDVCPYEEVEYSASNYIYIDNSNDCRLVGITTNSGFCATYRLVDMKNFRCGAGEGDGIFVVDNSFDFYSLCDCFEENDGLASVTDSYAVVFVGNVKAKIGYQPVDCTSE